MSEFLAGVERRAFKQALYAVREEQTALDIVQDAMMRVAERYAGRPAEELPPLFQRILQNAIRDYFRRQKVRSGVLMPLAALAGSDAEEDADPLETLDAGQGSGTIDGPEVEFGREQILRAIEAEVQRLPGRQREAFLLRYWEEMDLTQTAAAMGCSEGSVKTHCSRATHALASALRDRGIKL
jgi:RNA polymerase sigma-70 factor, ECF subfamily